MMDGDEVMGNAIKTEMEEEEKQEATAGPMKKRRKIPPKKAKKVDKPTTEDESSDLDDEDEDGYDDGEKVAATDEADGKPKASDDGASAIRTANFIPSMNGMGLLASVTDQMSGAIPNVAGVPALPTIPADQQLFFAEQQHAVRASMLENFAARANQQVSLVFCEVIAEYLLYHAQRMLVCLVFLLLRWNSPSKEPWQILKQWQTLPQHWRGSRDLEMGLPVLLEWECSIR
jgi:hypothetical protein